MAKGKTTTSKVTIEIGTDSASHRKALSEVNEIRDAIMSLIQANDTAGGGGGVVANRPRGGSASAAPPPAPPSAGGVTYGYGAAAGAYGSGQPPGVGTGLASANNGRTGMPGGGMQAGTVAINGVHTVNMIAQNVTIANVGAYGAQAIGGGGGGGGIIPPAAPGGAIPAPQPGTNIPSIRQFLARLLGGGAGAQFAGATAAAFAPVATYGIPAALIGVGLNTYAASAAAAAHYEVQATGAMASASTGSASVTADQDMAIALARRNRSAMKAFSTGLLDVTGANAAYYTQIEAEEDSAQNRLATARQSSARLIAASTANPLARDAARRVGRMQSEMIGASGDVNLGGMQMRIASEQNLMEGLGIFSHRATDPFMQNLRRMFGANAASQQQILNPMLRSMTSMNFTAFPGAFAAMAGGDIQNGFMPQYRADLASRIAQGDTSAIGPYNQASSSLVGGPKQDPGYAMGLAQRAIGIQHRLAVGGAMTQYGLAKFATAQASGAGYQALQSANSVTVGSLQEMRNAAAERLSMSEIQGNPLARAQAMAEVAQLDAQIAQQRRLDIDVESSERLGVGSAQIGQAELNTRRLGYRGVRVRANRGYQEQQGAALGQAGTIRDLLQKYGGRMSPQEKAQLELQAAQLEMQGNTDIPRERAFAAYGEDVSFAGLAGSRVEAGVAQSRLFGGPQSTFDAQRKRLGVLDQQLKAEEDLLADLKKSGATVKETNEVETRIRNIRTQRMESEEGNFRELYENRQRMTGLQQQVVDIRRGDIANIYGSGAAQGLALSGLADRRSKLTANRAEQSRLTADPRTDPDGTRMRELKAEEASLSSDVLNTEIGLTDYRPSRSIRMESMRLGVYASIVQNTNAGYGDVRGIFKKQMQLGGRKIEEVNQQRRVALQNASSKEAKDAINEHADQQIAGIISGEIVPAQRNLEMGWQERLISQVYNAPENFTMVASRFTQREASMFYGITNRAFGGNAAQSRQFRREGRMLYNTFSGAVQNPGGFEQTAFGGPGFGTAGEVTMQGDIRIHVILDDKNGNPLVDNKSTINVNQSTIRGTIRGKDQQMGT